MHKKIDRFIESFLNSSKEIFGTKLSGNLGSLSASVNSTNSFCLRDCLSLGQQNLASKSLHFLPENCNWSKQMNLEKYVKTYQNHLIFYPESFEIPGDQANFSYEKSLLLYLE